MIKPNVSCQIESVTSRDLYGAEKLSKPRQSFCNVVRLVNLSVKTSVRADSSASRGSSEEIQSTSRLLFLPIEKIDIGDKVEIAGFTLKVDSIQPRFTVAGAHDHNEVDLVRWA